MVDLEHIPIVLAFTPDYLTPAAACIISMLESSNTKDCFRVICLLTEPISEKKKAELSALNESRLHFSFFDLTGKLSDIYVDEKYTIAASYRLLLPDLLPEYNKVIYIDCDVIVRNNLAKLYWETDLGNNYLAGVFEATLDFQMLHMQAIGCEAGQYINSGFLIMNLDLLRKDNMVAKFLEASKEEGLEFPDQDVLNKLCKGRIMGLPPYYNSIRTFFLPQYKKHFLKYYTEGDWDAVQHHGNIHYTGAKPWEAFTIKFAEWWKYYEMLSENLKSEWQPNKKMQQLYQIYKSAFGRYLIDGALGMYRKVKYG